jgi:predicted enzyme related to lactoylglutathione lyase
MKKMKNALNWFEIPVSDMTRAKVFYESVFEITMEEMSLPSGLQMALFPTKKDSVGGALCYHPDFYFPGQQGALVYLNANEDIDGTLNRAIFAGGRVLTPVTQISENHGYVAIFNDSEGNRVALHASKLKEKRKKVKKVESTITVVE